MPGVLGGHRLLHYIRVQTAGQVTQAVGQTHHAQVIDLGQLRLGLGGQAQQLTLEAGEVGLDLCFVRRRQALQSLATTSAMRPRLVGLSQG